MAEKRPPGAGVKANSSIARTRGLFNERNKQRKAEGAMVAVNYYQHHIGDFNSATRHLTRVERSIYRDLIELYYDTESPLTANIDRLARKVMATNDHEFEALNAVLGEFFILEGDVYTHSRCDEELAKVYAKSDKARASAEKRWEKSKTKTPKPDQYQSKSNATAMRPQCERYATHYPRPNTQ